MEGTLKKLTNGDEGIIIGYFALIALYCDLSYLKQSINQSVSQSINQSVNQSINQSINLFISQSSNHSLSSLIEGTLLECLS